MTIKRDVKFSHLLIGFGLGAVGLMAAILARKDTREALRESGKKSFEHVNQLAGKLSETVDKIVQQGRRILGTNGSSSVKRPTTAEKQTYQEDRREHLGG